MTATTRRRTFVGISILALALVVPTAIAQPASDATSIEALLEADALAHQPNPVVLEFLLSHGRKHLTERQYQAAFDQITGALRKRTLVSIFDSIGGSGGMPGQMAAMQQSMKGMMGQKNLLRGALGVPASRSQQGEVQNQAQQMIRGSMIDPWARGLAAARALKRAGFEDDAAEFYKRCLATPTLAGSAGVDGRQISTWSRWVLARCEQGLVEMGLSVAGPIFGDLADRGQPYLPGIDSMLSLARAMGDQKRDKSQEPGIDPMPEIRAAGFSGIAALLETGQLSPSQRRGVVEAALLLVDRPKRKLDDYATAAGARTLGAAGDPNAEKILRKLSKREKKFPLSTWAAREALASDYADDNSIRWLERRLKGGNSGDNWDAFEILMSLENPIAWEWAAKQLNRGSVPQDQIDWRGTLMQRFAVADSGRSLDLLESARKPEAQAENYQQALLAVALFQRGERDRLPELEAAIEREDWDLGRRAVGQWWHLIKPIFRAGAMAAAGIPPDQESIRQIVANFAFGAYEQHRAQERAEAAATNALRFRVAGALAEWDDPPALPLIERLLESGLASTRLAAARALLGQTSPEALPLVDRALDLDYGSERGESRTPEIQAALLVHANTEFGDHAPPASLFDARRYDHPSVQFLASALASG